jgi:hypothetical protein
MPAVVEGHYGCASARAATTHQRITLIDLTIRQTHCRVLGKIRGQFRDLEQLSFQLR